MISDLIITAIDEERAYQDMLWGPSVTRNDHSLMEFLDYIDDYTAEARHVLCRQTDTRAIPFAKHSLRKIAALAVAAMEAHGVALRGYKVPSPLDLAKHGLAIQSVHNQSNEFGPSARSIKTGT